MMTREQLHHLIFLAGVVRDGNKRGLMAETIQCLIYIAKSLNEVDLPEGVIQEIDNLIVKVEAELRQENDRLHEIKTNMKRTSR